MPRTSTVHLLTGDYADRLNDLWSAAQNALDDKTPLTALEQDPFIVLKAEYDALKAEAIEAGITVDFKAVGRRVWRALKELHPPRTGDDIDPETVKQDRLTGANADAIEDDLVHASLSGSPAAVACAADMRRKDEPCHVKNPCSNRIAFDDWADDLSEGEWAQLTIRAWELANGARLDPKELPSSPTRSED